MTGSITRVYGPHPAGGGQCSPADGLFDGEGLNVTIAKDVVEPVAVCFVQQRPLIDAARTRTWILGYGGCVNLIKIAVGAASH